MAAAVFPEAVARHAYTQVLQCLDIDSTLSDELQVSALKAVAHEDLLTKIPPSVPLGPVVKGYDLPSFAAITAKSPTKHSVPLMIGSTDFDGAIFEVLGIFAGRNEATLAEDFAKVLQRFVPGSQNEKITQLLRLYGIENVVAAETQESRLAILQFGTDLKYFASARAYASSWPDESWLYYFNEQNPWEGPHKGRSAHCLDIAYLFLNYSDVMSEPQLEVATGFARDVIGFVYGEQPYAEFRSSRKMKVYGQSPEGSETSCLDESMVGPSAEIRKLWDEIGLDILAKGWDAYLTKQ
jgi:carboxylesterase type B